MPNPTPEQNRLANLLLPDAPQQQDGQQASSETNRLAGLLPEMPEEAAAAPLQQQGGMTPWRAATANPVEDRAANLALDMNRRFGTPLPLNQQHVEPETWAQRKAALTQDPAGLGANIAQGASFDLAGYFSPEIKRRAESYAGMHPTAAPLARLAGSAAPSLVLGPLGATTGGAIAGGAESWSNAPPNASLGEKIANTAVGSALGATLGHYGGRYLMPEESSLGTAFARDVGDTNLPTRLPVAVPAVRGLTKLGLAVAMAKHGLPFLEDLPFLEQFGALGLGKEGLHDLYTGGKNVLGNIASRAGEAMQPRIPEPPPAPTTWTMNRGPGGRYTGRTFTPAPPVPTMQLSFPQGAVGPLVAAPGLRYGQQPYVSPLANIIAQHLPGQTTP